MNEKRIELLDILRAFALILICHFHWYSYSGSYIGVIIFFVLSGYLFVGKQYYKTKSLMENMKNRISKLYPSLLFVIVISTLSLYFLNESKGLEIIYKKSIIFSIFPLNNIFQIFSNLSYFDNYSILLPLTHLWALSFQFQMYTIGIILIYILKKLNIGKKGVVIIFSLISVMSAILMSIYFNLGYDYSRIYYGTDTRAFAFFVSGAISVNYTNKVLKSQLERILVNILGFLGIIVTVFYVVYIDYKNPINYNGLMYLTSILLSFTVVMFTKRKFKMLKLDKISIILKPIIRLGQHQYEYYLWQYPIMIIFNELFKFSVMSFNLKLTIQIILLIIISEITHFIFKSNFSKQIAYMSLGVIIGVLLVSPNYVNEDLEKMKTIQEKSIKKLNIDKKIEEIKKIEKSESVERIERNQIIENQLDERKILFLGDSVIEMSRLRLNKVYPNSIIDNKVGRQFSDLPKLIKKYEEAGDINGIVVISLGTNGRIFEKDINKVVELLKGNEVYLINIISSSSWESSVNDTINRVVEENKNFHLIDWYGFAKGKSEYFYKDGVHLKEKFAPEYVNLIYNEVIKR